MKNFIAMAVGSAVLVATPAVAATTIVVDAAANSSTGGVGAATGLILTAGQLFSVSASLTDLWSAGALPRFSNANGLIGNLFATGSDESGQPGGTLIGQTFGNYTQAGLSAPYGALVGQIGGQFQLLGASFSGAAWQTGELNLFYWDSNAGDNAGTVSASVSAVPEPATWALMIFGFAFAGAGLRQRKIATRVKFAHM